MSSKFPQVAFSVPNESTYNKLIDTLNKAGYNWAFPKNYDTQYSWLSKQYNLPCISIRFGDLTHGDYRYFVSDLRIRIIDSLNNWIEVLKTLNMTTTFESAVQTVINDFVSNNKSFSLHEVTQEVRRRVNTGEVVLSDGQPSSEGYPAQVNHDDVKTVFGNMGLTLNVSYANGYRMFSPVTVTTPAAPAPTNSSSSSNIVWDHIKNYLDNKKGQPVTLKQIQSTLRRVGKLTCDDIANLLYQNNYNVQTNTSAHASKYIVS